MANVFTVDKEKTKDSSITFENYESIPAELTGSNSETIQPLLSFQAAEGIHSLLLENIVRVKYEKPTLGESNWKWWLCLNRSYIYIYTNVYMYDIPILICK